MATNSTTMEREIKFDRATRDFALYLDGVFVGYANSYSEGERKLDELAFEALVHGATLDQIEQLFKEELAPLAKRLEAAIAELQR